MKTALRTWVFVLLTSHSVVFYGCRKKEPPPAVAPTEEAESVEPRAATEQAPADPPTAEAPAVNIIPSYQHQAEAGCAMCVYNMEGADSCELVISFDDKLYPVVGIDIHDIGDPHAPDGLCSIVRTVFFEGHVDGEQIVATDIVLVPSR